MNKREKEKKIYATWCHRHAMKIKIIKNLKFTDLIKCLKFIDNKNHQETNCFKQQWLRYITFNLSGDRSCLTSMKIHHRKIFLVLLKAFQKCCSQLPESKSTTVLSHTLFLAGVSCRCQIQYIHAICKMLIAWHLIKKKIRRKTSSPEHDLSLR